MVDLLLFGVKLLFFLDDRNFPRFDIDCPRQDSPYGSPVGNIGMGGVLRAAISKSAVEAVAALSSGRCAVDLRGALLGLHINRREILVAAADDAAGQIVFQIADGHGAAHAHILVRAAAGIGRKAARDLEVHAGRLIEEHT